MSCDIIKSISVQTNRVFLSTYASTQSASDSFRHESPEYTELLRKQGIEGVLKEIARKSLEGKYEISNSSPLCRLLNQAHTLLKKPYRMDRFLDEDSIAGFMAHCAVKWREDPSYMPTEELARLETRIHKETYMQKGNSTQRSVDQLIRNAAARSQAQYHNVHSSVKNVVLNERF